MKYLITALLVITFASCSTVDKFSVQSSSYTVSKGDYVSFAITSSVDRCVKLSSSEGIFDTIQVKSGTTKTPIEVNARYQITEQKEHELPVTFTDCNNGDFIVMTLNYR
jgi:hypothetical protein